MSWYHGENRFARTRDAIEQHGFDALLALTPENAAYLAGRTSYIAGLWRVPGLAATAVGSTGQVAVGIPDSDLAAFSSGDFVAIFPHRLWVEHFDLRGNPDPVDLATALRQARSEGAIQRPAQFDLDGVYRNVAGAVRAVAGMPRLIGADIAAVPAGLIERLRRELEDVEVVDATKVFDDLRAVKDAEEIDLLRRAAELTVAGIAVAREQLVQGMTELAVNAVYQAAIWQKAAADSRYAALRQVEGVATVGNGAGGERVVGPGRTVKFDMQVDVGGYHSDIGRTYAISPTRQQREIYAVLHGALVAAQAVLSPGVSFREVHSAGTEAVRAAGFSAYSRGHLGHAVGLGHNYEDPPFIAADEARPIVPGMVLSLEVPLYLHGIGQFQMERMLLVMESGHEALDNLPFEFEIEPS